MAQFQKGHKLAPGGRRPGSGRKPKESKELLRKLLDSITLEEWEQIRNVAVSRARAGDFQFFQLLFAYQFGKPVQALEMSGPEGGPMEHRFADFGECTDEELKERLARASGIALVGGVQAEP